MGLWVNWIIETVLWQAMTPVRMSEKNINQCEHVCGLHKVCPASLSTTHISHTLQLLWSGRDSRGSSGTRNVHWRVIAWDSATWLSSRPHPFRRLLAGLSSFIPMGDMNVLTGPSLLFHALIIKEAMGPISSDHSDIKMVFFKTGRELTLFETCLYFSSTHKISSSVVNIWSLQIKTPSKLLSVKPSIPRWSGQHRWPCSLGGKEACAFNSTGRVCNWISSIFVDSLKCVIIAVIVFRCSAVS